MRIGIYLGRHAARGGGAGVFARSLAIQAISAISRDGSTDIELIFYGDKVILDEPFLERLSLLPELSEVADNFLDRGAGNFFRTLPNGARLRVVLRRLPSILGQRAGILLDQFLLPILLRRDNVELLHSAANLGVVNTGIRSLGLLATAVPQLVTVHDLFQSFPPRAEAFDAAQGISKNSDGAKDDRRVDANVQKANPPKAESDNSAPTLVQRFYRILFALQFRAVGGVELVVTDSSEVAREIVARYRFPVERTVVTALGLDEYFSDFIKVCRLSGAANPINRPPPAAKIAALPQAASPSRQARSQQKDWAGPGGDLLRELDRVFKLEPGYVLIFGSPEPRKNLARSIAAWFSHSQLEIRSKLVIVADDLAVTRQITAIVKQFRIHSQNGPAQDDARIVILPWVDREYLPLLLAGAGVLLHPTFAEGFGLPLIEAFAVGTPVVAPRLDSIRSAIENNPRLHFECFPESVESIAAALKKASAVNPAEARCADPAPRKMEQAVKDYFTLYRMMQLQFSKRRNGNR